LREAQRRLRNLIEAIEGGAAAPSLLSAVHAREAEIGRLEGQLTSAGEPLEQKLAVMATWVAAAPRGRRGAPARHAGTAMYERSQLSPHRSAMADDRYTGVV
jgi:hypothetical protein